MSALRIISGFGLPVSPAEVYAQDDAEEKFKTGSKVMDLDRFDAA